MDFFPIIPLFLVLIIYGTLFAGVVIVIISLWKTSKSAESIDSSLKEIVKILESK